MSNITIKGGSNLNNTRGIEEFYYFIKKVEEFHGHVCAGIAMGTKSALAAMRTLGFDPHEKKHKDLIVYVETDRCMTDAVQIVSGCTPGKRSLKYVDYGKFAATFVRLSTGEAYRVTTIKDFDKNLSVEDLLKAVAETPDEEMLLLQKVEVNIPETDLPGAPMERAICVACGERVMDGRTIFKDCKAYCITCLKGAYYSLKK
ncbi:MAG: FmdE family protein [Dehalococcoidales bacterium]|jgi:formylmethanofuran dehydrogenase subunit E|nr:FmdE family protein [Dehalococcoidales bacterium]